MKAGLRLSRKYITVMFEDTATTKATGDVVGLDIGIINVVSLSDGQRSKDDNHGWNLEKIQYQLCKKKKGSNGFAKVQSHRANYINWSIKQLNFGKIKTLRLENIKNVRRGKKTSRFLNHWTYTLIKDKLEQTCEKLGVQVEYICPTYTSQRCSRCGWVRSSNRKGKLFKCGQCSCVMDSDLNGSCNIAANLIGISNKERLLQKNRVGFYWLEAGQASIVPVT
jgi:IS605 OrfB family transposase